jgi:hypothetical protein
MRLSTVLETHHCARCHERLKPPAVYRDHAWYHARCWQEGEHQLANAERLAQTLHTLFPVLNPSSV